MSLQPTVVIFDLDGTLIDSVPLFTKIIAHMRARRGALPEVDVARARQLVSGGARAMVAGLLGGAARDGERDLDEFRKNYAAWPTPADCLYPGVARTLASLATGGHRLGICSNKPEALCAKIVRDLGLAALFSAVTGSIDGELPKPHPTSLLRTLARMDVAPPDACFVGDSEQDRAAAAAAGVRFVRVDYGYEVHARPDRHEPFVVAASDIPAVIARF